MSNSFTMITSGNIIALWQLLIVSNQYGGVKVKVALEMVWGSGLLGGSIPADQGLKLGQLCKLIEIDKEQRLIPSQYCTDNILSLSQDTIPTVEVTRKILSRYISFNNFDWLLFFNEDPEIFKAYLPYEWIEVLETAELFLFENDEVRDWWGEIFSRFQTYKEGQKIEIGKVAEKLTFEYEQGRIKSDGHDSGIAYIKWASQINDKYGYDILSIRGSLLKENFEEKQPVHIEVKSSVLSDIKEFRFFITRNEWTAALTKLESYYFYCWSSTSKENEYAIGPFIISALIIKDHIPQDKSEICQWSECRFKLDLNQYAIRAFA